MESYVLAMFTRACTHTHTHTHTAQVFETGASILQGAPLLLRAVVALENSKQGALLANGSTGMSPSR